MLSPFAIVRRAGFSGRMLRVLLAVLISTSVLGTVNVPGHQAGVSDASAAPTFWLPWQKGTVWYVRCGNFDCEHTDAANYYGFDANYIAGRGTDLVTSVADGTVIGVQNSIPDTTLFNGGHAGNCVIINHGGGYYSLYAHLAVGSVRVTEGQTITHGTVIGQMGNSGYSTGKHLHWSVGSSAWMYTGYGYRTCSMTTRESRYADPDPELVQDGGLPRAGRYYESFNAQGQPQIADPVQSGPLTVGGNLVQGGQALFTVSIRNNGNVATPALSPYLEGNGAGGFWRSFDTQPSSRIIQPGETVTFTAKQNLHVSGTWTINGVYLWNSSASQYWKPLPQNGQSRPASFTVISPPPTATFTPTRTPTATATRTPTPSATPTQVFAPSISLSKTKSKFNGKVQALLSGFAPNSTITVRWQDGTALATVLADSQGAATAWFRTPLVPYGAYRVKATDTVGNTDSTTLRVIPRIMLAPESSGPAGYRLRVYLYGFVPGHRVQVQWYTTDGSSYSVLTTMTIASNGRASQIVYVPKHATMGRHMVRGKVIGISRSVSTTFTVTGSAAEDPTATPTVTSTPTMTAEPTATATAMPTESPVATETPTMTPTPTETITLPEPTVSPTEEPGTPAPTLEPVGTETPPPDPVASPVASDKPID